MTKQRFYISRLKDNEDITLSLEEYWLITQSVAASTALLNERDPCGKKRTKLFKKLVGFLRE